MDAAVRLRRRCDEGVPSPAAPGRAPRGGPSQVTRCQPRIAPFRRPGIWLGLWTAFTLEVRDRCSDSDLAARKAVSTRKKCIENGNWYREVVQRREGIRVHRAGQRGTRRLLPSHRHPGGGLPQPRRGAEGGIRDEEGPEGPAGRERAADRLIRASWREEGARPVR